jgi:hypothetical protein
MDVTDKSKYTKIETEGRYKGEAYKDDIGLNVQMASW